jgi:hypothetical protein
LEVQILSEPIGEAAVLMLGEQDKVPFSLHRGRIFLGLEHLRVLLQDRDPGFSLQLGEEELQSFPAFQVPTYLYPTFANFTKIGQNFYNFFSKFPQSNFFVYFFFNARRLLATSLLMSPILYFWEMYGFKPRELLYKACTYTTN